MKIRHIVTLATVALLFTLPVEMKAQTSTRIDPEFIYTYSRPGYATQTVYIWGSVQMPGVWRVEEGTDLVELMSIVRATGVGLEEPGVSRRTTLKVYRQMGDQRGLIYETDLLSLFNEQRDYPAIQEGDIFLVQTTGRRKISWWEISMIMNTFSTVLFIVLNVLNVN